MRKQLLRLAARLYPSDWRRRYGSEFQALLEDAGPQWRDVFDVFRGAIKMQVLKGNFVRITAACGLAGLVIAAVTAFRMPNEYVSRAVLRVTPQTLSEEKKFPAPRDLDAVSQHISGLIDQAMSRTSLSAIIQQPGLDLYKKERSHDPLEDVIRNMQTHDIKIEVLRSKPWSSAFMVSFRYPDPSIAQRTTRALVTALTDENFSMQKNGGGSMILDLLDPASLPRNPTSPNRLMVALAGLAAGLITGILIALVRRQMRPA